MARRSAAPAGHAGRTATGHTRDVKVERVDGAVTIYKRGESYWLYFREDGKTVRRRVDGNLATARITARDVALALAKEQPTPLGFTRTKPSELVAQYLAYVADVKRLALRTRDRYRAALALFGEFCRERGVPSLERIDSNAVDDFVAWLRRRERSRNGAPGGRKGRYTSGGIRFVLATCRTALYWAARRRMLPPYAVNPFAEEVVEGLRDGDGDGTESTAGSVLTSAQEAAFFDACSDWQRPIFRTLAAYGLRVGELVHLLVEDVDFAGGVVHVRGKPELSWGVKTRSARRLPLTPETEALFRAAVGARRAGFVFVNDGVTGDPAAAFASDRALKDGARRAADGAAPADGSDTAERARKRAVTAFCRRLGMIPEQRVRVEFMKLTAAIGCPHLTRVHDLRHLFATRAQERGLNPLVVQRLLGHKSLAMTDRYSQFGPDALREAVAKLSAGGGSASSEGRGDGG